MSSHSSATCSAERQRSHSTPQKRTMTESIMGHSKCCDIGHTGESTRSFSPIYHDSFESETEDHKSHSRIVESESDANLYSDEHFDKGRSSSTIEQSVEDLHLSAWETWLLNKEKQCRIDLQKKSSEKFKQEEDRRKEQEKKELKKRLAEEQHKEWVRKKQEQERKENEHKFLVEEQETKLEEQKKHFSQVKSKEKYQQWLNKKKEEEQERKRKEKEEAESHLAQQREKKEKAEQIFKEWLEQAKNKPRSTLNSYGYVNGKLTGYYDGSSYPAPSFYNPIPWKPIPVPPPKETAKNSNGKKKRAVSSQSYRSNITIPYKPKDNLLVGLGIVKR